ncbi:MAG TPA: MFS transporter [Solirubrobacterales bacterium]|nr:MFS transporter [Solirubrobacterales bacterium]
MYQVEASKALLKPRTWATPAARLSVPRNVVLLGTVSMLTDISAEMVATVLPLYLVFSLGVTPLALGAIDGLYRGAAAIVQIGGGLVSDRLQRHKEVATVGYGLSALTKVGLVVAGASVGGIGALVAADRIGKGIRTAPRDALISLSSTKAGLATAFGVHRAMDSFGAMLGPLLAFGVLLAAPARFDAVFVVSTAFAFLGLAVLVLAVRGRPGRTALAATDSLPSLRATLGTAHDPRFRLLLVAAGGLALASVSDALIYVGLQRQSGFEPTVFPLLFVVTALAFMALAIPVGRLADRVGRAPVLLAGHALLLPVYGLLLSPVGTAGVFLCLLALGAYFAATDGVTTALAGAILPDRLQATGIGMLITVVSLGKFGSSLAFGALWFALGLQSAVLLFAAALALALAVATPLLLRLQREPVG